MSAEPTNNLTTSQNGIGRVPKLQPVSHFFLEGADFTQTAEQSFGVVDAQKFRTTSTVSFSGTKNIYALCMGTVFVQPQTVDANKVNLILKPYRQPVNGLSIKYIVYRGLQKSDFVASDGKIAGSETEGVGFVKYIWAQFNQFYAGEDADKVPEFLAGFIGFPHTAEALTAQGETHPIDQYFYKITLSDTSNPDAEDATTAYELPIVPRGIQLGTAIGEVGIDIILNQGDYLIENAPNPFQYNLKYARLASHTLDTSTLTDNFKKKLLRENCTDFLDIAAFYGLHANGAGKMYVDTQNEPLIEKSAIYARIQNFHSRNRFYLYIQSNRQRSYNFYNNYAYSDDNANDLKIGTSADTLTETTFATQGWPIHVFQQSQTGTQDVHQIALQLTTDSYQDAGLFVHTGVLASAQEENFVRQENLLQEATEDGSVDTNYTHPVVFTTPAMGEHTIAGFAQIIYEGKLFFVQEYAPPPEPDQPPLTPETHILKDIDDVFGLLNVRSSVVPAHDQQLPTIVDEKLQLINFPNATDREDVGAIKYKKVEDQLLIDDGSSLKRVTFETLLYRIGRDATPYTQSTEIQAENTSTGLQNSNNAISTSYRTDKAYFIDVKDFTDDLVKVKGLLLTVVNASISTKKMLGLIADELLVLKTLITTHTLNQTTLFFKKEYDQASPEGFVYSVYNLGVIAEDSSGQVLAFYPEKSIKVYTLDHLIFFSQKYSEFIPHAVHTQYSNYQIPEL
ncbi:hypothetical protein BKI52_10450 [marine bacterium AO1-C]|nr:hypothetical protein BKI52_10450 [marine bacterium AO1-C]